MRNHQRYLIICLSFLSLFLFQCSSGSKRSSYSPRNYPAKTIRKSPSQPWRPTSKHSIPVVMNSRVKQWIKAFNGPLRSSFKRWIYRIGLYGPTIEKVLIEEGAPRDLIYLSMIESGFNMQALSHASAVGPWQFISSTGKMYGLKQDFFVDDRQDLILATRAAARHLLDLHKKYNDWNLAFAAYNAGPGNVNKAMRRNRSKNYWRLSRLPKETRHYVPKILAALHIVKNYRRYGYSSRSFGDPLDFEQVIVPDATDVTVIAKSAGTTTDEIIKLNPSLKVGITPPGARFAVYIPRGARDEFESRYTRIPPSQRVSYLQYKTGRRETISSIAKKYKMSSSTLASLNKQSANRRLKTGTVIRIPANEKTLKIMAANTSGGYKNKVYYYKVRRGDTLSRIARKYSTSTSKIAKWNRLRSKSNIRIGQRLKIYRRVKVKSSPGSLLATYKPSEKKSRLSGVAHVIMTELKDGSTQFVIADSYDDSDDDWTQLEAIEPELTDAPAKTDIPLIVKTMDGETIDQVQEAKPVKPTKPKRVVHVVKRGENLSLIASKYDVTVGYIKKKNRLSSNMLKAKQRLVIQGGGVSRSVAQQSQPEQTYYTVRSGDNLIAIAKRHRLYVSDIKAWNGLKSSSIRVGQKLKLKGVSSPRYKTLTHKVRPGDTLWSLSKKYGVKISDIKRWNQLNSNTLRANQTLKINRS